MEALRKIRYEIFPDCAVKFFQYRLYTEDLSQFTVYGDSQKLKSFFKYVLCLKKYKDLSMYNKVNDFSSLTLKDFKHLKLEEMLGFVEYITNELNYQPQTKSHTVATVKLFYYYMYKVFKYYKKYYFEELAIPKYRLKTAVYMKVEECERFLSSINNPRDKAIIYLLLNTGARRCEVANALLCNLDLEQKTLLIIGKGDKERFLYLNQTIVDCLKSYLATRHDNCEYLFVTKNLNRMAYNDVYRCVRKYLEIANLDVRKYSTHKLRHTFATLLYQNGTDIKIIQELLGHSNIDTTMRYTHLDNPTLHCAVENYVLNKN